MKPGQIIKNRRSKMHMTLEGLAKKTSLSVGYISKLERSDNVPPFATLQKLAAVLEIDMAELLGIEQTSADPSRDKDIDIHRAADTKRRQTDGADYQTIPLVSDYKKRSIAPLLIVLAPGESEEFTHDAEEFIYVIEGKVTLKYKDTAHVLDAGDSAYIDSRKPHKFTNLGDAKAVILTANYMYRRF